MKLYIGENLKKFRMEKNVPLEMVAEYLGVTYQAVSRWENGVSHT
ncbi:MAG: helix-turn-helix transcriptional regulator [Clostridia bacterium]|nr:helix-turn-helix transcriptional regulator [Clostridia bacterium]